MPVSTPIEIESWLETFEPTAERMQDALRSVIESVLGNLGRPNDLHEQFNLGGTMAKRVHRAIKSDSATDVALLLPGRPTMMRFIEQAERLCTDAPELVTELTNAYKDFYTQVSRIASTHQELTSVLSVHDPRVLRESAERLRAVAYRATTDLVGGYSEAISSVWIAWPNAKDSSKGDWAVMHGYHGLCRMGVMNAITVSSFTMNDATYPSHHNARRLDGEPMTPEDATIIHELSSDSLPAFRVSAMDHAVYSIYAGEDLPHGKPVDIFMASIHDKSINNIRAGEFGSEQVFGIFNMPTKHYVLDLLVHKDMWPDLDPDLRVYNTPLIPVTIYPGDFWFREVPSHDDPIRLEPARVHKPIHQAPKHSKMIQYAIKHTGIDLTDFRIYRLTIKYPTVGNSFWLYFSRRPEDI